MKNIIYYIKEFKENIDFSKEILEDDYIIKKVCIKVKNEELDYYLNIINNNYSGYGNPIIEDIETSLSDVDKIKDIEIALANIIGGVI